MPGQILPGRPGNLTAEQEAKLREFWRAVFQVFGVASSDEPLEPSPHTDSLAPPSSDPKQKKKRLGIFKRSKKDGGKDDDGSSTVTSDSQSDMHIDGSDDKYGQTKEFHQALASLKPSDLRAAFWSMVKHDHPDGLLLRFLRARKWDVEKALVMLVSTMHWRLQEMHVDDDVVRTGEAGALEDSKIGEKEVKKDGEGFIEQLRMGKSFLHGTDKEGRPVCVVRVRMHRAGEQSEASLEKYTVAVIETARLLLVPPIDTAAILFDMTGFSMANMDYTPVKFMIKVFEANYPESLGAVLVHKAPWVFQGVWALIKGWLDPVVASKVHFTRSLSDLEEYIAKDHIMKDLGGEDPYEYHYIEPREGENSVMKLEGGDAEANSKFDEERRGFVNKYEDATRQWLKGEDTMDERNAIAIELNRNYWKLDPFIRARTLYDRLGVIGKDGTLDFYPSGKKAIDGVSAASLSNGPPATIHSADDVD